MHIAFTANVIQNSRNFALEDRQYMGDIYKCIKYVSASHSPHALLYLFLTQANRCRVVEHLRTRCEIEQSTKMYAVNVCCVERSIIVQTVIIPLKIVK